MSNLRSRRLRDRWRADAAQRSLPALPWVADLRAQLQLMLTEIALSGRVGSYGFYGEVETLMHQLDRREYQLPRHRLLARMLRAEAIPFFPDLSGPVELTPRRRWYGTTWLVTTTGPHKRRRRAEWSASTIVAAILLGDLEDWSP